MKFNKSAAFMGTAATVLLFTGGCNKTTVTSETMPVESAQTADDGKPYYMASSAEEAFLQAQNSTPELVSFIRTMPKGADLHNHLSGATYAEYLVMSAKDQGKNYNTATKKFVDLEANGATIITVDELIASPEFSEELWNTYSMHGWYPNTTNGHDLFFNTFSYMGSAGRSSTEMLAEVLSRNIYQNIQHVELMTGCVPRDVSTRYSDAVSDELFAKIDSLPMDSITPYLEQALAKLTPLIDDSAINEQLKNHTQMNMIQPAYAILRQEYGIANPDSLISVKFIYQLYRNTSLKSIFTNAVLASQASMVNEDIAGFNMVQAEDDLRSLTNFDKQMMILDFVYNAVQPKHIALHAGEIVLNGSPVEPMRNRISQSIKVGHAERIGHGIAVAWEDSLPQLLEYMVDSSISVEICLSSNESILGVAGEDHPFTLYRKAGVPVSLNTDDEGVSRSNLTMEFVKAVREFDLGYNDLKELARNSIEYSFLEGESLFERAEGSTKPDYAKKRSVDGEKAQRQKQLEDAFLAFESQFK